MDKQKIKLLIKRYEDVYLFATKRISTIMSEQVLNDLSIEQFAILRKLYERSSLRASELAEELGVNKSAITVKVEKLENKGFIYRERDQEDRRNIDLHLTATGKELYEEGEAKIENFVSNYLKELDHEDFEAFINLYEKIILIIQNHKEKPGI
ncbi:MarR family transcriptional regulator [Heyndrickxia sporothermodurans]|nr:MarR family transcriptional regulator [Heyndrickxia sporothermodurans]